VITAAIPTLGQVAILGRRIAIEQRERDRSGGDDPAERDERGTPSPRVDEPRVDRIEDDGAHRIAGAQHAHRLSA